MEVGAVSSTLSSAVNTQAQTKVRSVEQDQQTQQAQQTQQLQRERAVQSASSTENGESESRAQAAAESRPTVNTNGQVVGTRVNTTA